jgi:hypothetical protein
MEKEVLPEPVRLQGGDIQNGVGPLALECLAFDVFAKMNFRTCRGRTQGNLLVKQSKERIVHNPEMGAGISGKNPTEYNSIRNISSEK